MAGTERTDVVMQCEKCRSHFATFDVFMRHACITGSNSNEVVLKEHGFEFSWEQVQGRWKTLTTSFKKMKDHNRKSGNDRRTCAYEKELEEILGKRPSSEPVATCSTSVSGEREEQSDDTESKNSESNDDSPCSSKKKPRKTASAEVIDFLREHAENQKQEKDAERKERKAMFDQKMEMIKTLIDVMKK